MKTATNSLPRIQGPTVASLTYRATPELQSFARKLATRIEALWNGAPAENEHERADAIETLRRIAEVIRARRVRNA